MKWPEIFFPTRPPFFLPRKAAGIHSRPFNELRENARPLIKRNASNAERETHNGALDTISFRSPDTHPFFPFYFLRGARPWTRESISQEEYRDVDPCPKIKVTCDKRGKSWSSGKFYFSFRESKCVEYVQLILKKETKIIVDWSQFVPIDISIRSRDARAESFHSG